jgi:phosphomevalonate kinase
VRITAPGKLFLTGEYAVLWGAPAIVAAVSPRLEARAARQSPGITVRVPGSSIRGHPAETGIEWSSRPRGARFALEVLDLAGWKRASGLEISFSPGHRDPQGRKLGLGSSASASVAGAAAALWRPGGSFQREAIFKLAAEAHWLAQGRSGSGGDVAAATFGGLVRYERWPLELPAEARPPIACQSLQTAEGLHLALVSSGAAASTPSLVAAVEASLTALEKARFTEASAEATRSFTEALAHHRRKDSLQALDACGDLLVELGKRTRVELLTPALAKLQELGRELGLGAKVSGAGGGDSVVWASFDRGQLDEAVQKAKQLGYFCFHLTLETGVMVETL